MLYFIYKTWQLARGRKFIIAGFSFFSLNIRAQVEHHVWRMHAHHILRVFLFLSRRFCARGSNCAYTRRFLGQRTVESESSLEPSGFRLPSWWVKSCGNRSTRSIENKITNRKSRGECECCRTLSSESNGLFPIIFHFDILIRVKSSQIYRLVRYRQIEQIKKRAMFTRSLLQIA